MTLVLTIWLILATLFLGLPAIIGYVTQIIRERKNGRQLRLPLGRSTTLGGGAPRRLARA